MRIWKRIKRKYRELTAASDFYELLHEVLCPDPPISDARLGEIVARNPHSRIGETILHFCAIEDHHDIVIRLLEAGADPNTTELWGATPLMHAVQLGYIDVIKTLLNHGADAFARDDHGEALMHYAVTSDSVQIVQTLHALAPQAVQDGIDLVNDIGETPLVMCIKRTDGADTSLAKAILDLMKNPMSHARWEGTALHCAIQDEKDLIVDAILESIKKNGADINEADYAGSTALHIAIELQQKHTVEKLLNSGADPYKKDLGDEDAFAIAHRIEDKEIQERLERFRAKD